MDAPGGVGRRTWLASLLMGLGLLASYGTLTALVFSFLLPQRRQRTRRLFLGPVAQFPPGSVHAVRDLEGNVILIRRTVAAGFQAFSSVCPHLGCKVHWEAEANRFFCPCHRGVFDPAGVAIGGPPGDAGQRLSQAPIAVDEESGAVYLAVNDPGRRGRGGRS